MAISQRLAALTNDILDGSKIAEKFAGAERARSGRAAPERSGRSCRAGTSRLRQRTQKKILRQRLIEILRDVAEKRLDPTLAQKLCAGFQINAAMCAMRDPVA